MVKSLLLNNNALSKLSIIIDSYYDCILIFILFLFWIKPDFFYDSIGNDIFIMICIEFFLAFSTMAFLHVNIVKIILFYGLLLSIFYIYIDHFSSWIIYIYLVISINQIMILKNNKIDSTFRSLWFFAEKPCYFIISFLTIMYLYLWGADLRNGINNEYMLKTKYNENIIPLYLLVVFSIIYYSLPIIKKILIKLQVIANKKNEELNKAKENLIKRTKKENEKIGK